MIEVDRKLEDFICDAYAKKNIKILGSGYEAQRNDLFLPGRSILLKENDRPIMFFCKSNARTPYNTIFSSPLLFDDSSQVQAKFLLEDYLLRNGHNSFIFAVEDYLSAELNVINALSVELDHVAIRMLNDDIAKIAMTDRASEVVTESFVAGRDEARFVDIFNKTFVGLCKPTNIGEVRAWTQSSKFYPEHYIFAVKNGITVGFIAIEVDAEIDNSYLQEIGVINEERGKGVAESLMKAGFESVLKKDITRMGVGVLKHNEIAAGFFSKWGFRELYRRIFLRSRP